MTERGSIVIIDYGLGNLFSIKRAFEAVGTKVRISSDGEAISRAEKIVIPGVGAFSSGLSNLNDRGLIPVLNEFKNTGKYMLGICLGMQLMLTTSEEDGQHRGLGFIEGEVLRFDDPASDEGRYKIPQIGWNTITPKASGTRREKNILNEVPIKSYFYFVHSYYARMRNEDDCIAETSYGRNTFSSVISKDNLIGMQFHPELSGSSGLGLLESFSDL